MATLRLDILSFPLSLSSLSLFSIIYLTYYLSIHDLSLSVTYPSVHHLSIHLSSIIYLSIFNILLK